MSFVFTVFLALLSWGLLRWGQRKGFFAWQAATEWNRSIKLGHVAGAFLIYFAASLCASWVFVPVMQQFIAPGIVFSAWLVFLLSTMIALGLAIYCRCISPAVHWGIWREGGKPAYTEDIRYGLWAFVIAAPLVILLGHVLEWLTGFWFQLTDLPDQSAVRFVKMTLQQPTSFLLAAISISVLAPLIEETLFRGFLQSFIRKHLGSRRAIVITAVCFSCFHFSWEQGASNIPIIGSLFCLALFLGFLYEKRRCLLASITLHSAFNTFSILNLFLFGDVP